MLNRKCSGIRGEMKKVRFTADRYAQYAYNELVTVCTLGIAIPPAALLWAKWAGYVNAKTMGAHLDFLIIGMICIPIVLAVGFGILKGAVMYITHACATLTSQRLWKKMHRNLTVKQLRRLALNSAEEQHDQTYQTKTKEKY